MTQAQDDPRARVGDPERLLHETRLDPTQKRSLLAQWRLDERLCAVAEDENMCGSAPILLAEVSRALSSLGAER